MAEAAQTDVRRRRSRPRRLTPARTHEDVYLSELSIMGRLGRPETYDAGLARNATEHSFSFPKAGLTGRYDTTSGKVVGARLTLLPRLVTAAWGSDAWFSENFLEMVPRPELRDVRGERAPLATLGAIGPDDFEVGDPEVVFRVRFRTLLQAAGLLGTGQV